MAYDLIGKSLGAYRIDALIGLGGMAEVYRAWQPSMERHVALKLLPVNVAEQPDFAERFRREARTLAQLQHTHILPVFDFGEADNRMFLVMPLMENGTIATRVRGRRVPLEQVVRVGVQVGDALAYAHERGVVHCDVKPGNILLDERGNCLLSDFGIARMLGDAVSAEDALGTPAYMAPEQAGSVPVDGRADVFALGVVLYELAVGARPFRQDDAYARVHGVPQPPSSIHPALPQQLDWILLRALAQKRDDRFTDASEMVQALRTLPTRRTVGDASARALQTPQRNPAPPQQASGPPRRRARPSIRAAAIFLSAVVLMLALAATFLPKAQAPTPSVPARATIVIPTPQQIADATAAPVIFDVCGRKLAPDLAVIRDVAASLGCPSQDLARNRAAAVQEHEHGFVVFFAPPGSENTRAGVAYVLVNDGSAERVAAGDSIRTTSLGSPIGAQLTGLRADFQSFDNGRVFRVRGWRDARTFTVALTNGRIGVWR